VAHGILTNLSESHPSRWGLDRENQFELGSAPVTEIDGNLTPMGAGDFPGDIQAQAKTLVIRVYADESFENAFPFTFRNRRSGIENRGFQIAVAKGGSKPYPASLFAVANGIADEVVEAYHQESGIA
jgi:hypothetical protein